MFSLVAETALLPRPGFETGANRRQPDCDPCRMHPSSVFKGRPVARRGRHPGRRRLWGRPHPLDGEIHRGAANVQPLAAEDWAASPREPPNSLRFTGSASAAKTPIRWQWRRTLLTV